MITDAGRAHLAEIADERAASRDAMIAERKAAGLADLDVGSYVWADDGATSGLVVDADEAGLVVLDSTMKAHGWALQVRRIGGHHASSRMLVAVRRIAHEAVEVAEPRTGRALGEYAKACWLAAGIGTGDITDGDLALARYGDWLAEMATGRRAT